tara:strand:+ start:14970 stop:15572 length:603 start_codon:yes stop_codon:yes gene_type:complete
MGNMFSNTLVEMVNKCKNDSEEDGCDKTMTVDGKKVRISIVDLQNIKDGMETEVQHLYDSDDIYDEMNYLIKLKKNNNCDGQLNIEYKCGVPEAAADTTADTTTDATADTTTDATTDAAADTTTDATTDAAATDTTTAADTTADTTTDATTDAAADTTADATTDSQEGFINSMNNKECILLVVILFTLWIYRKKILKILK